jgi:hypothetical protein
MLTVMSDLDPHLINKLKDEIKSWFIEFWAELFISIISGLVYTYI